MQLPWELCGGGDADTRTDKPETYVDAPISLQLVGRRYEDEKLIEALEMMSEVAGLPFKNQ